MSEVTNEDQYRAWNGESGLRWVTSADRRDEVLAPVADALWDHATLVPGEWVLDLGCGCGVTTLDAAARVAPAGTVVGVDLSEPMLGVARRRAVEGGWMPAGAGVSSPSFVQADVQVADLVTLAGEDSVGVASRGGFDVAISRFGTMFYADPRAAFTNIAAALVPGARLCLATWRPLGDNPWLTVPGEALLAHVDPAAGSLERAVPSTDPSRRGMFGQSDPEAVRAVLGGSGFVDVDVAPVDVDFDLGADAVAAAEYLATTAPGRALLDQIPDGPSRLAALDAVRDALEPHVHDGRIRLGGGIWIVTAQRP